MSKRIRTGMVASAVVLGIIAMGQVSALGGFEPEEDPLVGVEEDIDDVYNTLPPWVTETIAFLTTDQCELGLEVMESQGYEAPNTTSFAYEYDPLSEACQKFRDAIQHNIYSGNSLPYEEHCRKVYGQNCVAIGHYACDFALMAANGLVYVCLGGLDPYN